MEDENKVVMTISNNGDISLEFIPDQHPDEVSLRTVMSAICLKEMTQYIRDSRKAHEKNARHA